MTPDEPKGPVSRGQPVPLREALPPVETEVEYYAPDVRDVERSRGKPVRICESLPPVTLEMFPLSARPVLVLRVADPAPEAVADVLLKVVNADWAAGGSGLTRDHTREAPQPGVVTLALIPDGPAGHEAEERLRELARRVASPTVTATVIPAA
ncbi:MAG TPA: hypothetical protein VM529_03725 [Gemmata sp.]|nr:hypothetical protein [Gemmata sp.]